MCVDYDIKPDILTMSKQITSSYFPFSAFMINDRVYDAIAEETGRIGVLGHGYTGGGHPVGAAVALENIKIIEDETLLQTPPNAALSCKQAWLSCKTMLWLPRRVELG